LRSWSKSDCSEALRAVSPSASWWMACRRNAGELKSRGGSGLTTAGDQFPPGTRWLIVDCWDSTGTVSKTKERKTTRADNGTSKGRDACWRSESTPVSNSCSKKFFRTVKGCLCEGAVPLAASAMLPGMAEKPGIAIVGAGNLGTVLALALREAGYRIESVTARGGGKSLARAKRLARQVRSRAVSDAEDVKARVLWLCVPDSEIARAAESLAERVHGRGKIALHSSGALSSDELEPLRKKGVAVASVHPLMTFVRGARPSLAGVPFAVEGDPAAVRTARNIVRDLEGEFYAIRQKEKNAYHAWGTFASPLLTALLATAEEVAGLAGVSKRAARKRMLPILLQTVKNYGTIGAAAGFSGPIVRGDVETVRRHLEALRRVPVPRRVYIALARAALESLPAKNKESLRRVLSADDFRDPPQ
jgi:predicted short-subunit dehydrogenase-like oxidoreductase (DUF2520 family)